MTLKKLIALLIAFTLSFALISCGESESNKHYLGDSVYVDIYAVNDLHGNVLKDGSTGEGIAKITSYLNTRRSYSENTIVISSGDMWQGSSESNNTKGNLVTDWMNIASFDAMTLGNHEFDWGVSVIEDNLELADFPFLAINVYETETDERADFCDASVMVELSGVEVGIIGAIGDCYSSISSSMVNGYYFKTGEELTELVKEESQKLRDEGADIIVYSLHDGSSRANSATDDKDAEEITEDELYDYYDISLSDGYVDVVLEAHTHKSYIYKDSYGVYHVQASSNNREIAYVRADYNKKSGDINSVSVNLTDTSVLADEDDSETLSLFTKYADEIGDVYSVIGTLYRDVYSDEIKNLVASLYLETGLSRWGADYDIFLGGGYLNTRSPYNLYAGFVTYKDIQTLLPFDNDIVLCSISGYDLKAVFLNTRNSNYYMAYSDYGELNYDSIEDDGTYYVIVDSYTSDYAPNHLTLIDTYGGAVYARDLVAEYIKADSLI